MITGFGGAIFVLALFLIMWKKGGVALLGPTILFLLYCYLGNLFSGLFHHSGLSVRIIVEESILGFDGVYNLCF